MKFVSHCKEAWCFVGGLAAAAVVAGLSRTECVRNGLVKATAQGMILKDNVSEAVQSIKDDAEDLTADAREEAKRITAEAEMRAEIEKRVREEVEKEFTKCSADSEKVSE